LIDAGRVGAILLAFALGGWSAAPAAAPPLRVSVAVSLRPALADAVASWRTTRADVPVALNSGASGVLVQQVRRGAPADLLIAASSLEVDGLLQDGLAQGGTRRRLASNRLVIVVPRGAVPPAEIGGLFADRFALVALGNPKTAPLGRYTRQALSGAGLWPALEPRAVQAESARQTLDYVARGEVDAGIVYATDARLGGSRVLGGPEFPDELHEPIAYDGVVLSGARRAGDAAALLDWLASEAGREVFARHGFLPP
jgi:molybdate transport system substrate-binding protein